MNEPQINQLKFRVTALESALADKQSELEQFRNIEQQADNKIKAMKKIQDDKVKNLLNSMQILKKEKANIEGLSKEHKRSKLIDHLNKQILDQDTVIQILRKFIYEDKGKEQGRKICDEIIVKQLIKGPERIRPLTREELRIQIDKQKSVILVLESKMKNGDKTKKGNFKQNANLDNSISDISSVSDQQIGNQNQQIYKRLKTLQLQNENIKLQLSSKSKILEKLKNDLKETSKLKGQIQLLTNELQISKKKSITYESLLSQSKQSMNNKLIELYERQLKVEELELNSKQNSDKLSQANEHTSIILKEIQYEKEQLMVEIDSLKKQNQQILLENITNKKRQDDQKNKINEIRQINDKNKNDLGEKLKMYEQETSRILKENQEYKELNRSLQSTIFKERAEWVETKASLIEQIENHQSTKKSNVFGGNQIEQTAQLRKENQSLKQIIEEGGGSSGDNSILLERLENYRRRLEFYEGKADKTKERQYYDDMFKKYNDLMIEMQQLKRNGGVSKIEKSKKKALVEVTKKQQEKLKQFSSGISSMNLEQISSGILDNYDSSYDYELVVNDMGQLAKKHKEINRITEADRQLLKLISSDMWSFIEEDKVGKKIQEAIQSTDQQYELEQFQIKQKVRQIKNLNHPQGQKITLYEQELNEIEKMSDNVSITSALERQMNNYDSDVNIEIKKVVGGHVPINMRKLKNMNDSVSSVDISSAMSGQSNLVIGKSKKKIMDKGNRLKISKDSSQSEKEEEIFDSDVSSIMGMSETQLDKIGSDVSGDFRKRKNMK